MTRIRVVRDEARRLPPSGVAARTGAESPALPLTHHEILALVAPFTRRGLHLDMAASQREARILRFKPLPHPPSATQALALESRLTLEVATNDCHRLVRQVWDTTGLCATATLEGSDLEIMLDQLDALPVGRQIDVVEGVTVARSYRIDSPPAAGLSGRARGLTGGLLHAGARLVRGLGAGQDERAPGPAEDKAEAEARTPPPDQSAHPQPMLQGAMARVAGVTLELRTDRFDGPVVPLRLAADAGLRLRIPEDLLAVIGWSWRPLRLLVSDWRGSIRVAADEPARTADIEAKLARTIRHLARTLATPPAEFHRRHRRARWRASLQRGIPLLIGLLILAAAPATQWLPLADDSVLRMLIFHAPPLLLMGFFMLREIPRIELPPIPRALTFPAWIQPDTPAPTTRTRTHLGGSVETPAHAAADRDPSPAGGSDAG